jgi:hypothetical protein
MNTADLSALLDRLRVEPSEADAEVDANLKRALALRQSVLAKSFAG